MRIRFALLSSLLVLSGCGTSTEHASEAVSGQSDASSESSGPAIPASLSSERLAALTYTLTDMSVRSALTRAHAGFQVIVSGGFANLPPDAAKQGFRTVHADTERMTYGDVTGDGIPEAVVPIFVSHDNDEILELAAVTDSGGTPMHFASFPIGVAQLNSVNVTSGKIRVNFTHQVTGDPGPRNTELMLELPKK